MIVCYIYFTRIVVYLLKITVAFQYAWFDEMFKAMGTYVFFVLTGYKFRPTSSHPYFTEDNTDDDYDDDDRQNLIAYRDDDDAGGGGGADAEAQVLTETGLTEGVHKTKAINRNTLITINTNNSSGNKYNDSNSVAIESKEEERENLLLNKRESSHEYD